MAAFAEYKCSKCGYEVGTSSGHKFYRDSYGELKIFMHPGDSDVDFKGWV